MNVRFDNVVKHYGGDFKLDVSHFEIAAEERIGLVGNNGAGKTTLLLTMLGLLRIQKGTVYLDGESVREFGLGWRKRTASYLGEASLIPFLNPWEFWKFVGDVYGVDRQERLKRLEGASGFVQLASGRLARKKYIREYSLGNRKKIGLVAAWMVHPSLLVLDEPFTNLDPRSRMLLQDMLLGLNREYGTTIVVSSHDLEHVVDVSNRIALLEAGAISFDGSSDTNTLQFVRDRLTGGPMRRVAP